LTLVSEFSYVHLTQTLGSLSRDFMITGITWTYDSSSTNNVIKIYLLAGHTEASVTPFFPSSLISALGACMHVCQNLSLDYWLSWAILRNLWLCSSWPSFF